MEAWTVADGLPQSNVRQVSVGPEGYLWVTTPAHLTRFDGSRFERVATPPGFQEVDSPLAGASVAADGAIWLHGYRRVWRFAGGQWQSVADELFRRRPDPNEDVVRLVHQADGSTWWLLRGGVVRWRAGEPLKEWLDDSTGVPTDWWSDLIVDAGGTVWMGAWNRVVRVGDKGLEPVATAGMFDERPFAPRFAPRKGGGVWCYAGTGLFVIGGSQIERVGPAATLMRAEAVIETSDGAVWAAGDAGVACWHDGIWSLLQAGQVPGLMRFTSLAETSAGVLWLGGDGGMACLRSKGWRVLEVPAGEPLAAGSPSAAWTDGRGETLVGIRDRIYRLNRGAFELAEKVPGEMQPGASVIAALARDAYGTLWVGTGNEQLWFLSDGIWKHTTADANSPVPAVGITAILPVPGQAPLIGSGNGLMRITARDTLLPAHPGLPLDRVQCLARDPLRGGIWIGYESHGLVYFEPSPNQVGPLNPLAGLPGGRVNAVLPDAGGTLWISVGTELVRWDGTGMFRFTRQHGLPQGEVGQLAEDGEGGLWLAHQGRLVCVPVADFEAVESGRRRSLRVRHHGYGLPPDAAFNPLAGERGQAPGARFAVAGGIIEARSRFLPLSVPRPDLRVRTIRAHGKLLATPDPPLPLGRTTGSIRVPAGKGPLDLDFNVINGGPASLQEFRFRLADMDGEWTNLDNQRSLSIPYLPPGTHRIELAVRDAHGEWVGAGSGAVLLVEARFWQTRWFLALCGLGGAGLVFSLTRWVLRRRYRRRLEREKAIHQERSRIARDIHDDLGAGLTHLAMVARIAERDVIQQAPPTVLAGHLQEVFTEAGAMVRSVDEIVWAVTPANDHLLALTDYLGQYAQHFLRAAGIGCRVDLPESIPPLPVRSAVRHHLYMVVHEALNNIVKHAAASQVFLSITLTDERLGIIVADDGCGFDPAQAATRDDCDGLRNFASRMAQIGGDFVLDTAPGNGTRTHFEIPLEQANRPIHPS